MHDKRIALVTGANHGVGFQVAKELAANGHAVLVGSRDIGYAGAESLEAGSREMVRVALLGPEGPTGTFTRWENTTIPW